MDITEETRYIGEIKRGHAIGRATAAKHIWWPCDICGKPRWVRMGSNCKPLAQRCPACNRRKFPPADDAGNVRPHGKYLQIKLARTDFFHPMTLKGDYVMQHRLVMAQHLNRCLQPWEIVHHKNGIKTDNRLENLELTTNVEHSKAHGKGYHDGYIKGLRNGRLQQIQELRERIRKLEGKADST